MNWNSRHCNILCCFFLLSLLLCCSFKHRCTLPLLLSFNLILYFIQPRLFPPCYDNGRELSMFNEWLEAGYRFRNILVTVNTRSSSIICSHTVMFHGSSAKCAPTEAQIYFGRVSCSFARCMFSADVGFPE